MELPGVEGVGVYRERYGNHSIQDTPRPGHLLQVTWDIPLRGGQLLTSGGPQPSEGMPEVGAAVYGVDQVGCRCPDLGGNVRGGGSGGHAVQLGDVVDDTMHWEGVGRISPQGGP